MEVAIIGGGIGGLTLALALHGKGISCRIFESAPELKPLGLGINVLPHAMRVFSNLGLETAIARVAIDTAESAYINRFGQIIYREPAGRLAGYDCSQYSIHRADLHEVLVDAFVDRIGSDKLVLGHHATHVEQEAGRAKAFFKDMVTNELRGSYEADVVIGCDGLHSPIRKQFHPDEGDPVYSGVNMWRGCTWWKPFLSGASMVRAGWLKTGKLVVYPMRKQTDDQGRQLINWVVEIETPSGLAKRDWNRVGLLDDFIWAFEDWHHEWLDVPRLLRASEMVLEFPMVDQNPLDRWSFGQVTLLGDAAHPMYPRGSNGAVQAILDADALANYLKDIDDPLAALNAYDADRRIATGNVVLMNRTNPPDAILREVYERTGDRPFHNINDVISPEDLASISNGYKLVSGYGGQQ